jgi:hypothetical protein
MFDQGAGNIFSARVARLFAVTPRGFHLNSLPPGKGNGKDFAAWMKFPILKN